MERHIAESVEIALIHMLFARAELVATPLDACAEQRALEHVQEANEQLKTLVQLGAARGVHEFAESIENLLIQTIYAVATASTANPLIDVRARQRIDEVIELMTMLAPQRSPKAGADEVCAPEVA